MDMDYYRLKVTMGWNKTLNGLIVLAGIVLAIYDQCVVLVDRIFNTFHFFKSPNKGWVAGVSLERLSPWEKDFKWVKDKMNKTKQHSEIKSYSILKASNFPFNI